MRYQSNLLLMNCLTVAWPFSQPSHAGGDDLADLAEAGKGLAEGAPITHLQHYPTPNP